VADVDNRRPAPSWSVSVTAAAADLCVVDALARLQLAVARRGGRLVVEGADDELRRLLDLAGLTGVVRVADGR
jgi:anti-anti-sigma regulatory factor